VRSAVRGAAPDVICIAGFPWILPPGVYQAARLAAINVHPSLLPRHRGLLPLFWVYHADDRETGVTVHRVTERADAGGILEQEGFPLPRGCPVDRLNDRNGMAAGLALRRAVTALAEGVARERSQDERLVTTAPAVQPGTPMVDFAAWDVERVWHFLAGLFPRFIEPLSSDRGPVRYGGVRGFRREVHSRAPGTVAVTRQGPELYCADGVVELDPS
jgi:methionyl-tRNA formyltransferase